MSYLFQRFTYTAFVLLALLSSAQAQDELLPTENQKVQIEVMVFRFPGQGAGAQLKANQQRVLDQGVVPAQDSVVTVIASSELQLSGAYSRLQASSDVKPLLINGWSQELSETRWISLRQSEPGPERVIGRLQLIAGKPLSVKLELQLDDASLTDGSNASFRLRAERPAHFQETIYFDHPAMGVLVRIDPQNQ